jgi:hypothetical protein
MKLKLKTVQNSTISEDKIPDTQWLCEVLSKLLEEIASLREIVSLLQSERIQYTHPLLQHDDDNNWCQAARGK